MSEPVAYYKDFSDGTRLYFSNNEFGEIDNSDNLIKPLYTKEKLQPRVKMTKKQHKQFENYKVDKNSFYYFWQSLLVDDVSLFKEISERDLMLAWLDSGAIEIIPEKKWFVRSKKAVGENNFYAWLFNNDFLDVPAHMISDEIPPLAMKFDTKEQAEKWTNPLTEAVQLPVEGN